MWHYISFLPQESLDCRRFHQSHVVKSGSAQSTDSTDSGVYELDDDYGFVITEHSAPELVRQVEREFTPTEEIGKYQICRGNQYIVYPANIMYSERQKELYPVVRWSYIVNLGYYYYISWARSLYYYYFMKEGETEHRIDGVYVR